MQPNRLQVIGAAVGIAAIFGMHGYLVEDDLAKREPTREEQLADARKDMVLRMAESQCGDSSEVVRTARGMRCVNDAGDGTLLARVPDGAR